MARSSTANRDAASPERHAEKVTELTKMEDRLKQFNEEKFQKLAQLDKRCRKLDRCPAIPTSPTVPRGTERRPREGDLKKAKEQFDELKKKVKKGDLSAEDKAKLQNQIEKMKNEVDRLAKDKEKQKKLEVSSNRPRSRARTPKARTGTREAEGRDRSGGQGTSEPRREMQKAQQALAQNNMEDFWRTNSKKWVPS